MGERVEIPAYSATRFEESDCQIAILGKGVGREAPELLQGAPAKGANCTGDNRDAVQKVKRSPIEILTGDVFYRLPACQDVVLVADFHVPGDSGHRRIGELFQQDAQCIGTQSRVSIDTHNDVAIGMCNAEIKCGCFAAIRLCKHVHTGTVANVPVCHAQSAVS